MSTALVTDSTAYLPADLLEGLAVHVVPLHVVVGGTEHAEGVDIDPGTCRGRGAALVHSRVDLAAPAPAAFLAAYRAAADAGADAVVSVHISGDMSSTIGGAVIAAEESPVPVTVVDSRALGMAMGYAVLTGARLAAGGASAAEVADAVRAPRARHPPSCSTSTPWSTCAVAGGSARRGRWSGRPCRSSRSSACATATSCRWSGCAPRPAPSPVSRTSPPRVPAAALPRRGASGVDVAVQHLDSPERAERLAERLRAAGR